MQKILRMLIIVAMLITGYLLILAWRDDYVTVPPVTATAVTPPVASATDVPVVGTNVASGALGDVPSATPTPTAATPTPATTPTSASLISVSTDKYDIRINPVGGDVVYAALKEQTRTLDSKEPFVLLQDDSSRVYVAQSGLIGKNGIDTAAGRANYTSPATQYVMQPNQSTLTVPLTYQKNGVTITKNYTFTQGQYPIAVSYNINNASNQPWQGQMYAQIKRDSSKDPGMADKGMMSLATYLGGAWGTADKPYNKLKFGKFNDGDLKGSTKDGWVAMVQHYFVSAWIPKDYTANFFSKEAGNDHIIGFTSNPIDVAANKQTTLTSTLYAGPKVQSVLKPLAPGLDQTVDYSILWPIAKVLFWGLKTLEGILGNWGWAIIGLTVLVKLILLPIATKSYYSMAKMRVVAPRVQALKDEHGDDRMRMSQEMMKIYKEEKVNPMAGCLPVVIQMPIFLSLYWVIVETVELRHAPWMGWIRDLSSMDPYFILPLLMGAAMFLQQQLNPQPQDPMQARVMKFLPIIFTVFMLFFPAGLVLYWTVNNLFSMAHQYYINTKVDNEQKRRASMPTVV